MTKTTFDRAVEEMRALREYDEKMEVMEEVRGYLPAIITGNMILPYKLFYNYPKHARIESIIIKSHATYVKFCDGTEMLLE